MRRLPFLQAGGKIAVLEKEAFPRDKYCGDAVCTPAIRILTEMGVMQAWHPLVHTSTDPQRAASDPPQHACPSLVSETLKLAFRS